jgi:hypothetical protein
MSLVTHAVQVYFQEKHPALNQTDLITFHVEFLSRSDVGPATISIHPLKLGRQFSTVRVELIQHDSGTSKPRTRLEALITQGNLSNEAKSGGISLPTHPILAKESIPKREDCEERKNDSDLMLSRPAAYKIQTYFPPGSDPLGVTATNGPSVKEQWSRWMPSVGTSFSISSLPFLADAFRPLPDSFGLRDYWYPTLSYGMQVKRGPPAGKSGWKWLFMRIEVTECRDGRFDNIVVIADEEGNVVAICTHTALIVSFERNSRGRVTAAAKI